MLYITIFVCIILPIRAIVKFAYIKICIMNTYKYALLYDIRTVNWVYMLAWYIVFIAPLSISLQIRGKIIFCKFFHKTLISKWTFPLKHKEIHATGAFLSVKERSAR